MMFWVTLDQKFSKSASRKPGVPWAIFGNSKSPFLENVIGEYRLKIQYSFFTFFPVFVHNWHFGVDHKSDNLVFYRFSYFYDFPNKILFLKIYLLNCCHESILLLFVSIPRNLDSFTRVPETLRFRRLLS
jgi:hypothetical protein